MSVTSTGDAVATVTTAGELSNEQYYQGGVAYIWEHSIFDDTIEKSIQLRYHDIRPEIRIIEPIVQYAGMSFHITDSQTVLIKGKKEVSGLNY